MKKKPTNNYTWNEICRPGPFLALQGPAGAGPSCHHLPRIVSTPVTPMLCLPCAAILLLPQDFCTCCSFCLGHLSATSSPGWLLLDIRICLQHPLFRGCPSFTLSKFYLNETITSYRHLMVSCHLPLSEATLPLFRYICLHAYCSSLQLEYSLHEGKNLL